MAWGARWYLVCSIGPWRPRRAGGLQRRQHVCRARAVAARSRGAMPQRGHRQGRRRASSASGRSRVPACAGPIFRSRCRCWARARRSATATICVRPATSLAAREPRPRAGRSGRPNAPRGPTAPPYQSRVLPEYQPRPVQPPPRGAAPDQPVSLEPPSVTESGQRRAGDLRFPATLRGGAAPRYRPPPESSPRDDFSPEPYERRPLVDAPARRATRRRHHANAAA